MAPRLASKYKVITFDWYGHGQSAAIPDYKYNKDNMLEQLQSIVTALIDDDDGNIANNKFHLYSVSMGSFLALHYTRLYPERINKIILHSPWNAELNVVFPFGKGTLLRFVLKMPGLGSVGSSIVSKFWFRYCHDGETFRRMLLGIGEGDTEWTELIDDLAKADVPSDVLLMCGTKEKAFYKLAKYINDKFQKKSELHAWPKGKHTTWCDDWDKPAGTFFRDHAYNFLTRD
eukprot:552960-Ditylum_brightwellii.AAC.1